MAEGRFDDYETQDSGEKYPEYDDMNYGQLLNEYESVTALLLDYQYLEDNPKKKIKYEKRFHHLGKLLYKMEQEKRVAESTFTSNKDEKTVNITNKKGVKTVVPSIESDNKEEDNDYFYNVLHETIDDNESILDDDILEGLKNVKVENQRHYNDQLERVVVASKIIQNKERINLNPNNPIAREILDKSSVKNLKDGTKHLYFRSNRGVKEENSGVEILKRGKTSTLLCSNIKTKAYIEYKELIGKLKTNNTIDEEYMVDTTPDTSSITGLTENENRGKTMLLNQENTSD